MILLLKRNLNGEQTPTARPGIPANNNYPTPPQIFESRKIRRATTGSSDVINSILCFPRRTIPTTRAKAASSACWQQLDRRGKCATSFLTCIAKDIVLSPCISYGKNCTGQFLCIMTHQFLLIQKVPPQDSYPHFL